MRVVNIDESTATPTTPALTLPTESISSVRRRTGLLLILSLVLVIIWIPLRAASGLARSLIFHANADTLPIIIRYIAAGTFIARTPAINQPVSGRSVQTDWSGTSIRKTATCLVCVHQTKLIAWNESRIPNLIVSSEPMGIIESRQIVTVIGSATMAYGLEIHALSGTISIQKQKRAWRFLLNCT